MLKELIEHLTSSKINGLHESALEPQTLIHNNTQQVTDLEPYALTRRQYRAQFNTTSLSAFTNYLQTRTETNWHSNSNIQVHDRGIIVAIDQDNLKASATLDHTERGQCLDTAHINLKKSPEYKQYLSLDPSRKMAQREAIEWVEDWSHCIHDAPKIITALKKIELKKAGSLNSETDNFKESASLMESIELANSNLPSITNMEFVPANGLVRLIPGIRIKLHLDSAPINISFQAINAEHVREEVAEDFAQKIKDDLKANIHIGTIDF